MPKVKLQFWGHSILEIMKHDMSMSLQSHEKYLMASQF